ncbi:MAG: hypothetical protein WBV82_24525 [Myxococcaceae bacterium]
MDNRKRMRLSEMLLVLFAVPLVAVLFGGVYSYPAMKITNEREPWLSILLAVGLAVTVFGLGALVHSPLEYSAGGWALGCGLLLVARRFFGTMGRNLERFGVVHLAALVITFVASALARGAV